MADNKCCVVMITHKNSLSGDDERSFKQAIKVLYKRDIFIVIPEHADDAYYQSLGDNIKIKKVQNEWLESYKAYNETLRKPEFYEMFKDYCYLLTYQTDCWIFEDRLDYFIGMWFDWYGAPLPLFGNSVGNGGFSLRKVDKMIYICNKYKNAPHEQNEDYWFCLIHKNELNICDLKTASEFSLELYPERYLPMINGMPMGFHGKDNIKYWSN